MPTREAEVVTYLRTDEALALLLPGGIYSDSSLSDIGITDRKTTPDVWAGGIFRATAVVRQRAAVPQYRVYDQAEQLVDVVQMVEIYLYALAADAIQAAAQRIYVLMTDPDNPLPDVYTPTWQPGLPIGDAPNLPKVKMQRDDYALTFLRTAVI